MRARTITITAAVGMLIAGCSNTRPPTPTGAATTASPSAPLQSSGQGAASPSPVAGGCGSTQLFAGPGPDAALGLADNPWARATPSDAGIVAYFWHPPPDVVFASSPSDHGDKVLWISHEAQSGNLVITAHPLGKTSPVARFEFPEVLSPSNYPSGIDLPSAGCWHLDLAIGAVQATIDLLVAPARSPLP